MKAPKQRFFTVNEDFLKRQPNAICLRCMNSFQLGQKVEARRNMRPSGLFHAANCWDTAQNYEEDLAQTIGREERESLMYQEKAKADCYKGMVSEEHERGNFPDNLGVYKAPMECD